MYKKLGEEEDKSFDRKKKLSEAEDGLAKAKAKNKTQELALVKKQAKEEYDLEYKHLIFQKVAADEQIKAIELIRKANGSLTDDQQKQLDELKKSLVQLDDDTRVAVLKYQTTVITADKEISANRKEEAEKASEANKKKREKELEELKKQTEIDINNTKKDTAEKVAAEEKAMDDILAYSTNNAKALGLNAKDLTLMAQENAEKKKEIEADYTEFKQAQEQKQEEADNKQLALDDKREKDKEDLEIKLNAKKTTEADKAREALALTNQKELDDLNDLYAAGALSTAEYNDDIQKMNKQTADANIAINKKEQEEKTKAFGDYISKVQSMQSQMFDAIGALTDAFKGKSEAAAKKAFDIQKGLSVANATVSGIEATVKALSAPPGYPFSIPFAAAAAAMAVANIAKIEGTKFSSGGGSGGSSSPTTSSGGGGGGGFSQNLMQSGTNTPVFNGIAGQNMAAAQNSSNGKSSAPTVKAYVVSSDVENSVNKSATISRRSKFQ
jgi:hypothetical protein